MLHELGWKDLKDRRRHLRLALLYKMPHGHIVVPAETLKLCKPTRQLGANHKHKYQTLPAETTELKSFVVHRTIPEWNTLPACIAKAESIASFKLQLAQLEGTSASTPALSVQHLRQHDTLWQRFSADYWSRSRSRSEKGGLKWWSICIVSFIYISSRWTSWLLLNSWMDFLSPHWVKIVLRLLHSVHWLIHIWNADTERSFFRVIFIK